MQMSLQLGPTESCMTRDMSKPLVQVVCACTPSPQSRSLTVARQLAGGHGASWLAASASYLCPGEQAVITNPKLKERF